MATSTLSLFLLSLSVITLTASARPCKTLFFYATSTSYYPTPTTTTDGATAYSYSQNPNPNFDNFPFHSNSPKFITFFLTNAKTQEENHPYVSYFSLRRTPFPLYYSNQAEEFIGDGERIESEEKRSDESMMPLGIYSSVSTSSIRDRTKDIMSVVGALLFGVGCGALTAATMFLIWSLFSPHRFEFEDSDDEDEDDVSHKKIGYVAIPEDVDMIKKGIAAQKELCFEIVKLASFGSLLATFHLCERRHSKEDAEFQISSVHDMELSDTEVLTTSD